MKSLGGGLENGSQKRMHVLHGIAVRALSIRESGIFLTGLAEQTGLVGSACSWRFTYIPF